MHLLRDETGSAFVVATIVAVVLGLLGAAVVGVGLWFEHRRAVQVRADAAALAGGQMLTNCFNIGVTDSSGNPITEQTVDAQVEGWAKSYGGMSGGLSTQNGAPYNHPYGPSSSDLMSFQSDTNPSSGNASPTRNLGDECFKDGDPTNTDPSNVNLMLDVRMSQEGIPFVPPFLNFLGTVHGWARVQLQELESAKPAMPLAVPDIRPKDVAVTFVNEATGAALAGCSQPGCVFHLSGPTAPDQPNDWGGLAQITLPAANVNVAMRVGIGTNVGSCAGVNSVSDPTTDPPTRYTCYDYSSGGQPSPRGIIRIRSYDGSGSGSLSNPILRSVTPTTCSGTPFFSASEASSGSCTASVRADIDFGGSVGTSQVRGAITGSSGGSTTFTMTHMTGNTWVSSSLTLPTEQGPYDITLDWRPGSSGSWNHFAGGNPVQQIFSGSDGTDATLPGGPISAASVLDNSDGSATYSFAAGSPVTLAVAVGLFGGVHLGQRCASGGSGGGYTCATDPPLVLRFQSQGGGGLTYAVDCGVDAAYSGGNKLGYEVENGCANFFSLNDVDVCPDPANPSPTDCAPVNSFSGSVVGPIQQAMKARFVPGGICDANNYPAPPDDDPRAVTLIVTDFSAWTGTGGTTQVPVVTFATFYITGWDGAPAACIGINEPPPPNAISNGNSANVWGHFITYRTNGMPSGKTCKGTITPCVLALVR